MKKRIIALMILGLVCVCKAEEAYQVTAKVWKALGRKDWDSVVANADRAIRIWGPQARRANKQLKDYAPAKEAMKFGSLNEVGGCILRKGEALDKKGDKAGAMAAYQLLPKSGIPRGGIGNPQRKPTKSSLFCERKLPRI